MKRQGRNSPQRKELKKIDSDKVSENLLADKSRREKNKSLKRIKRTFK